MELKEAISKIINDNFSKGDYFDSHAVINELLKKEYHQVYLNNYPKGSEVKTYHSQIAQKIGESRLAEKVKINAEDVLIYTHTIYGELNKNHLWKRI